MDESPALASPGSSGGEYVVVARRYRPQTFDELIGQEHVARGLSGAILSHRVGHAYLFTGARGVGKTSAARILAKALNCVHGPAPAPCNECDICRSISSGDDVDVLEIDGASNRGIDEIRQLRQNVNMRPSRSRFKVYIIDEVHMLTREAFNALLKTLEEPPEHVKFIFCTTEPEKIPITILSRCQRYDFAGIQAESIATRLRQIAVAEGVEADDDAIALLARRAAGSMRDSQSLLEQLLSLGGKRLTTADVHAMLGTAGGARLDRLVGYLVDHQPAGALTELDTALSEGVDVGQLLDQLLGYFRNVMAAAAGCGPENFLYTDPGGQPQIATAARQLGLETILAILQIIEQTLWRLRFSTQARTLAELALVRIAKLDDLERLSDLIAELRTGVLTAPAPANVGNAAASGALAAKKKADVAPATNGHPAATTIPAVCTTTHAPSADNSTAVAQPGTGIPIRPENALQLFQQAAEKIGGLTASSAQEAESASVVTAIGAPNQLVVTFPAKYNYCKKVCEASDKAKQLETALAELTGSPIRLAFAVSEVALAATSTAAESNRPMSSRQREMQLMQHPLVKRASELFGTRGRCFGNRAVETKVCANSGTTARFLHGGSVPFAFSTDEDKETRIKKMFKGLGNLASMLKQAQQMGGRLQALQEELKKQRAIGRAGADLVEVEVNGLGQVLRLTIDPGLVQRGDREMLEDLIPAAVNQALAKAKELHGDAIKELTGGMNLPPLDELIAQADSSS